MPYLNVSRYYLADCASRLADLCWHNLGFQGRGRRHYAGAVDLLHRHILNEARRNPAMSTERVHYHL